mgnify:CR=1 FL=1
MPRDPAITHRIMSAVRSKNTKPELLLRKTLWHRGLRFRANCKSLPGNIAFTRAKVVVFCDGDYWHGHNWAVRGISSLQDELAGYSDYWRNKIAGNMERDARNTARLEADGWSVIRLWASEILADTAGCADIVEAEYYRRRKLTGVSPSD